MALLPDLCGFIKIHFYSMLVRCLSASEQRVGIQSLRFSLASRSRIDLDEVQWFGITAALSGGRSVVDSSSGTNREATCRPVSANKTRA
jgi:hypothetical protein